MSTDTMDHLSTKERKASLRKSNKPIMEKRRRARINSCLSQLKTLVLEAMRKDSSQYSKLEKADILEMTVKHLRNLQRQQMVSAIANDPNVVTKYRAGFHECANEVVRYLGSTQNVDPEVKSRLVGHLSTCLQSPNGTNQNMNSTTCPAPQVQQNQQQVSQQNLLQPLRVHIPQNMNNLSSSVNSDSLLMTGNTQQTTTPVTHVPSPNHYSSTISTPVEKPANRVTGQFQILPGNIYNGPVAVYVGHVNQNQQTSPESALSVFTLQVPKQQNDFNESIRVSPISRNKENTSDFSESDCDLYKMKSMHMKSFHHDIISCKNVNEFSEKLWRPW